MKKTLAYLYLIGTLIVPTAMIFAHGGEEDGHIEAEVIADPGSRIYVMVAVGVVFALMVAWIVWSKIKSKAPMD